jgi:pseudaminic acid biosynthesis-associated methylase
MTSQPPTDSVEAQRLEGLWSGGFGNDYVDRNTTFDHRRSFWQEFITTHACDRVLEVGCNVGGNLQWISSGHTPATFGVDINAESLRRLRSRVPSAAGTLTAARSLPFRDAAFDLVFTMGVLIHQPDTTLGTVMAEMVRCSKRWVLCGEYFSPETMQVPYRGQEGALFKRDYGRLFSELFPDLRLLQSGFLGRDTGWDDVTWWLLART